MNIKVSLTNKALDYFEKRLPESEEKLFRGNVTILLLVILMVVSNINRADATFDFITRIVAVFTMAMVVVHNTAFILIRARREKTPKD